MGDRKLYRAGARREPWQSRSAGPGRRRQPQMLHRHFGPADAAPGGARGDGIGPDRPNHRRDRARQLEEAKAILADLPGAESIEYVASRENIAASVNAVAAPDMLPLVITTGDNALHTAEMVRFFCDALDDLRRRRHRPHPGAIHPRQISRGESRLPPLPRRRLLELQHLRAADAALAVGPAVFRPAASSARSPSA